MQEGTDEEQMGEKAEEQEGLADKCVIGVAQRPRSRTDVSGGQMVHPGCGWQCRRGGQTGRSRERGGAGVIGPVSPEHRDGW